MVKQIPVLIMMRKKLLLLFFLLTLLSNKGIAQVYAEEIKLYRENYIKEFKDDERSPLKGDDLNFLRFYDADQDYKVEAVFQLTTDAQPFEIATSSGKTKPYIEYGVASFQLNGTVYTLHIYQSITLKEQEGYRDYLFLPYTDTTNGGETYGGGRYLDFRTTDIKNNKLTIDFNKSYNPYCAYATGYSCPKPPAVNDLPIEIKAGEKKFGKELH